MQPAERDTYKRAYKEGGTFHYPKIEANRLRRKGAELYFRPMEVTGSREGTAKKPMCSLLKYFLDIEIPNMDTVSWLQKS
jgi:hypothetical protein